MGFQQQEYDAPTYIPDNVVELAEAIHFPTDFGLYQEMDLYQIKGRIVPNRDAKKILAEVEWVISGKKTNVSEKRVQSALDTISKKESKGWRKADGYK